MNTRIRIIAAALPALVLVATHASAAPESKPAGVEKHIEVRMSEPPRDPVTFLGVEATPVDEAMAAQLKLPPEHGLVVRFVVPDSPAAAAGLQKHDILTRLDDQILIAPRQLAALVRGHQEGDTVRLTYLRAGGENRATIKLTRRVPPNAASFDTFHWFGGDAGEFGLQTQRHVVHAGAAAPGAHIAATGAPMAPRVMVFRPQTRIIYREGEITLEVTSTGGSRELVAHGADGSVIFQGPIDSPEQRQAVPADLRKLLERLDAIEPSDLPLPPPEAAPHPMPLPAPAPSVSHGGVAPHGETDVLIRRLHSGDDDALAGAAI